MNYFTNKIWKPGLDLGKWLGGGCCHALLFGNTMLMVRHRCWHTLFGNTWLSGTRVCGLSLSQLRTGLWATVTKPFSYYHKAGMGQPWLINLRSPNLSLVVGWKWAWRRPLEVSLGSKGGPGLVNSLLGWNLSVGLARLKALHCKGLVMISSPHTKGSVLIAWQYGMIMSCG